MSEPKNPTDRVRNDGNWIYGDPDYIGEPGKEGCMMNATHIVGAPPLPDFEGWETPQYGFLVNQLPGNRKVMFMSYYVIPGHRLSREPKQLTLFDLRAG